jgi:hypothetical protein
MNVIRLANNYIRIEIRKKQVQKISTYRAEERLLKRNKIFEKWMNWEISTFEYLMYINLFSNRSFNDLSHYPVFPWLHLNTNVKEPSGIILRDLSCNMGQLGSKERLEEFIRKYEEGDWFEKDSYHYGSHYSHPGIVLHYLIRLHPLTEGCLALQGGQYDVADRLFYSVDHALESALNDISDVREIIPEFFFLPEMFQKHNIKFGEMQDGTTVNEVELPGWANNPHEYVCRLKELLESEQVCYSIHRWIDYIYGYKQKGKEAIKSINVYPHYTYDTTNNPEKESGEESKIEAEVSTSQAYNFGQAPTLLFKDAHKQRLSRK